jgi:tRNA(fMet)-specific endonuclease VapC
MGGMSRYMLDTNAVSYLVRGNPNITRATLSRNRSELCISAIAEAELLYGIERNPAATRVARMISDFLSRVESLPWTSQEAACFAVTRTRMELSGKSLTLNDMLIAAHALSIGATLVTSDMAFRHVPGLAVEDWR